MSTVVTGETNWAEVLRLYDLITGVLPAVAQPEFWSSWNCKGPPPRSALEECFDDRLAECQPYWARAGTVNQNWRPSDADTRINSLSGSSVILQLADSCKTGWQVCRAFSLVALLNALGWLKFGRMLAMKAGGALECPGKASNFASP
jgi:hypothetical protein